MEHDGWQALTPRGRATFWGAVLALLLCHVVAAWLVRPPILSPDSNDDGLYLILGQSLQGGHYRDTHVVGQPAQAQYPPGLPLLLAVALAVHESVASANVLTILLSALGLLAITELARRLTGPWPALLLLAALALNPLLLDFAGHVYSEPPFIAALLASVLVITAWPDRRWTPAVAGGLAIYAALTRSAGIGLPAAIVAVLLLRGQRRAALLVGLAALLLLGAWFAWTARAPEKVVERSYMAVMALPAHNPLPASQILRNRLMSGFHDYVQRLLLVGSNVPTVEGTALDNIAWLGLLGGLTLVGLVALLRRAVAVPLAVGAYYLILVAYPFRVLRFGMPVLPLLLLSTVVGLGVALQRRPRWLLPALLLLLGPIALQDGVDAAHRLAASRACRAAARDGMACFTPVAQDFLKAAAYARDSLPGEGAVVTVKEAVFARYTGRRVLHPQVVLGYGKADPVAFMTGRGVRYVLFSGYPGGAWLRDLLAPHCTALALVHDVGRSTFFLSLEPPAAGRPNACGALARTLPENP